MNQLNVHDSPAAAPVVEPLAATDHQARIDAFKAHMDTCRQCSAWPIGLCPLGSALLDATVDDREGA